MLVCAAYSNSLALRWRWRARCLWSGDRAPTPSLPVLESWAQTAPKLEFHKVSSRDDVNSTAFALAIRLEISDVIASSFCSFAMAIGNIGVVPHVEHEDVSSPKRPPMKKVDWKHEQQEQREPPSL